MSSLVYKLAVLAVVGCGVGQVTDVCAETVNGNFIGAVADAPHKDFEVTVTSVVGGNYTVNDPKHVPEGLTTNLVNKAAPNAKILPDKIPKPGTPVTVTWTTAIAKGDVLSGLVIGSTATGPPVTVEYKAVFTSGPPVPVPDLGWSVDSSGNVSLANGDSSAIDFSSLAFFVQPDGVLTEQEINAFLSGSLPLTPAGVPSGVVAAGGTLFVDSFSPGAALIAGFDASYADIGFSPVTASDGLLMASTITAPEPSSAGLLSMGVLGMLGLLWRRRSEYRIV